MFPGQGAQQVGMGRDLADNFPEIASLYQHADEIVGYDLSRFCFEGPEDQLNRTEISQPALFVTSAACLTALRAGKIAAPLAQLQPDFCAGLSLGEYTALYAAGAMSFEDGLRLVQLRGQGMQQAAQQQKGSMVSVLGLDESQVNQLCAAVLSKLKAPHGNGGSQTNTHGNGGSIKTDNRPVSTVDILVPVNFNCPGQIVLSGTLPACNLAVQLAESFAAHALPLKVAGAFHTKMMAPAAHNLKAALHRCKFTQPCCPVFANVDALVYQSPDQIPDKLLRQLVSPVLWQQTVEKLLAQGAERFVEIGPGRVLNGLVKKIARPLNVKPTIINISGID